MKERILLVTTKKKKIIMEYEQPYTNTLDNLEEMDKFLERHKLPKVTPEEIANWNRPLTSKETFESVIKENPPQRKAQDQTASVVISTKYLKN